VSLHPRHTRKIKLTECTCVLNVCQLSLSGRCQLRRPGLSGPGRAAAGPGFGARLARGRPPPPGGIHQRVRGLWGWELAVTACFFCFSLAHDFYVFRFSFFTYSFSRKQRPRPRREPEAQGLCNVLRSWPRDRNDAHQSELSDLGGEGGE
jgi:hypothetical protein